ncbi:unnamed protein product, partial [Medioppia subpectinata]
MSGRLVSAKTLKTAKTVTAADDSQSLTYESICESFVPQKSFKCHYDGCGKSLSTQSRLDSHISRRHAIDGSAQSGQTIGNSLSDRRRTAATPEDSRQLRPQRRPITATPVLPVHPVTTSRSDYNLNTTHTVANTHSSATSGQTPVTSVEMLQTIRDPRLRKRSTEEMASTIRDPRLRKRYGLLLVGTGTDTPPQPTTTTTTGGRDNSPINTSQSQTPNTPTVGQTSSFNQSFMAFLSATKSVATQQRPQAGASSQSAPVNTCHTSTTETNTRKRGRRGGRRRGDYVPALTVNSTVDQSSAGRGRRGETNRRQTARRGRKRCKPDTNYHVLEVLPSDEDTNSDTEIEVIADDSPCVTSTVPSQPLTTQSKTSKAITADPESDSDIEIVAIVSAPTAQTTSAATAGPSKLSPPPVLPSVPPVLPQMAPPLPPPPPPSAAIDTAIRLLAIAQTVSKEGKRLSVESNTTSPTISPVPSDMEMDTDIDDSELLCPPNEDLPTDATLPDSDYYTRFDSLVERVSRVVEANTTADDCDVKPMIGASVCVLLSGDTSTTDLNSDITCDIKPDVNAIAHNSMTDITVNSAATAAGDSVSQIAGQPVVTQSDTDVSATDEALIDVKPLISDLTLQTVSDHSLATTLSTQTKDTASVEPIVAQILTPLIVNNNINANRDEQSCVGTTPIDAVITNTDSQTIAVTNHKNTAKELTVNEDTVGVNSGQGIRTQSTAPVDKEVREKVSERRTRSRRRSTLSEGELIDDETVADSEREYECRECRQPFGHNRYEYNEHLFIIHGERHPYRCDYDDPRRPLDKRCGKQYDRAFDYVRHQRSQHDLRVAYECEYSGCDQYFDHRSAIKEHIIKKHGKQSPFVCDRADCGQSFGRETQLYAHKRDDHTNRPVESSHSRRSASLKDFQCEHNDCGQQFARQSALDDHNENNHLTDWHECDAKDCNRTFVNKSLLNEHKLRDHSLPEPVVSVNHSTGTPAAGDVNPPLTDTTTQSVPKPVSTLCLFECDFNECFGMFTTEEILQKHKRAVHQKHNQSLTSAQELSSVPIDTIESQTLPSLSSNVSASQVLPSISSDNSVPQLLPGLPSDVTPSQALPPLSNDNRVPEVLPGLSSANSVLNTSNGGLRVVDIPVPTPANTENSNRLWDTILGVVSQPPAVTITLTDSDISDVISETIPALDTIGSSASDKTPTGRLVPPPLPPHSLLTAPLIFLSESTDRETPSTSSMNTPSKPTTSKTSISKTTTSKTKTTTSKTTTNASGDTISYSEKRYKCDKCSKTYGRDRNLKRHQKCRHGVREPYRCYWDGCERRYPKESRLAAHVRDIHRTRGHCFRCRYGQCERRFKCERLLNVHRLRAHDVDHPYRCRHEPCGVTDGLTGYPTAESLRQHVFAEHNPYKCHYRRCDRAYDTPGKLRQHRLRCWYRSAAQDMPSASNWSYRSEDSTYVCNVCHERFTNWPELKTHMSRSHKRDDKRASAARDSPSTATAAPMFNKSNNDSTADVLPMNDISVPNDTDRRVMENTTGAFINDIPVLITERADPSPVRPVLDLLVPVLTPIPTDSERSADNTITNTISNECSMSGEATKEWDNQPSSGYSVGTGRPTQGSQSQPLYKCDECDQTFLFGPNLADHKACAHSTTHQYGYVCRPCEHVFANQALLDIHVRDIHVMLKNTNNDNSFHNSICAPTRPPSAAAGHPVTSYPPIVDLDSDSAPEDCAFSDGPSDGSTDDNAVTDTADTESTGDDSTSRDSTSRDNTSHDRLPITTSAAAAIIENTVTNTTRAVAEPSPKHSANVCRECDQSFKKLEDLNQHRHAVHSVPPPYRCSAQGCGK